MRRKILILDTSVLCCWLKVPGKEEAGPVDDRWDHARIQALLDQEEKQGTTFVLPIATLIETGNHIAQAPALRFELATRLGQCLLNAANAKTPWAAFTEQSSLWQTDNLLLLATKWPNLAKSRLSMGDATIKEVADYYAIGGWHVEIITGDAGLKAYEPPYSIKHSIQVPRRRK